MSETEGGTSEEASGIGGSVAKAVEEDDDDEDRWTEDDDEETDAESQQSFKKNKWTLVAVWTNIDKKEAYRRVAEIMKEDFEIAAGRAPHKWGEPSERKIGPFGQRSVSIFLVYSIELVAKQL